MYDYWIEGETYSDKEATWVHFDGCINTQYNFKWMITLSVELMVMFRNFTLHEQIHPTQYTLTYVPRTFL